MTHLIKTQTQTSFLMDAAETSAKSTPLFLNVDVPTLVKYLGKSAIKGQPFIWLTTPGTTMTPEKFFVHDYKVEQGFGGPKNVKLHIEHAEIGVMKVNTTEHLSWIYIRM